MSTPNYRVGALDRIAIREKDRLSREALRTECAWCGSLMRDGKEPTSHGICFDCSQKHFPRESR